MITVLVNLAIRQESLHMSTMPVPSTNTCDEQVSPDTGEQVALRGFRKRWAQQSEASGAHSSAGEDLSDFGFVQVGISQLDDVSNAVELPRMDLQVTDMARDDLSDELLSPLDSKKRRLHVHERQALESTDLKVFKYPWERGRLKKFFSNEPWSQLGPLL